MFPAIFLDRDGVLIENRHDYVREWSHVNVFPEAIRALSHSSIKNYKIVVVTNQSAVGRGLISMETALQINKQLMQLIRDHGGQIDGTYMCPHTPKDDCACRKPKPGMLLQASRDLSLDLQHSWMIGDAWSDVQAGQAAGVQQCIMLKTGRGTEQLLQPRPANITKYLVFDDLNKAVDAILESDKIPSGDTQSNRP